MMFAQVLATEFVKLRRSAVPWFTLLGMSMGPLGIALFMWIVREPKRAKELGLLGTKAELSGLEATFPAYASTTVILIGAGGMLLLSFIVAHVFGREYAEGTAKNMLTLPAGRHWFVLAKLVVSAVWWAASAVCVIAEALVVARLMGLPGYSAAVAWSAVVHSFVAAGIAFLLAPVVAWIAVLGRGYMAPLGFAMAAMALGNLLGKTGWSVWFPWSIVPSLIGMVGAPQTLPAGSYVVLGATFLAGVTATIAQVRWSDLAQ